MDEKNRPQKRLAWVVAHSVGRVYGGPEEGGWWYDSGEPLASVPVLVPLVYRAADQCQCAHDHDECSCDAGSCSRCGDPLAWHSSDPDGHRHDFVPGQSECHGEIDWEAARALPEVQKIIADLERLLGEDQSGPMVGHENQARGRTRTSVIGDEDLVVGLSGTQAEYFPTEKPHYE